MSGKFKQEEITKLLDLLIGGTEPYGDSAIDKGRLENTKVLIDVINWCLDRLEQAARARHSFQASMREIGETAFGAIAEYKDWCEDVFNNC